jgi:hypothetical protein
MIPHRYHLRYRYCICTGTVTVPSLYKLEEYAMQVPGYRFSSPAFTLNVKLGVNWPFFREYY